MTFEKVLFNSLSFCENSDDEIVFGILTSFHWRLSPSNQQQLPATYNSDLEVLLMSQTQQYIYQFYQSLQWKISAHTLTIKLSPSPARPSIVVISLNNHFEQFLSKQHLFCTSHFLSFVRGTFDTTSCITIIIVMNNTFYTHLCHHSSYR